MPERFEIYIVYKRCYINTLPFLSLLQSWHESGRTVHCTVANFTRTAIIVINYSYSALHYNCFYRLRSNKHDDDKRVSICSLPVVPGEDSSVVPAAAAAGATHQNQLSARESSALGRDYPASPVPRFEHQYLNNNNNKSAPYGTGGRLLLTANFKVT